MMDAFYFSWVSIAFIFTYQTVSDFDINHVLKPSVFRLKLRRRTGNQLHIGLFWGRDRLSEFNSGTKSVWQARCTNNMCQSIINTSLSKTLHNFVYSETYNGKLYQRPSVQSGLSTCQHCQHGPCDFNDLKCPISTWWTEWAAWASQLVGVTVSTYKAMSPWGYGSKWAAGGSITKGRSIALHPSQLLINQVRFPVYEAQLLSK